MSPARLLLVVLVAAACSARAVALDATAAPGDAVSEVATQADASDAGGAQPCTAGRIEECPCGDGRRGTQTCQPSGSYGPCVCADAAVVVPDVARLDASAFDVTTVSDAAPPDHADAPGMDAGCDALTATDPNNCGACGAACPARPNAVSVCESSRCAIVCVAGYGDCNRRADDGCEADLVAGTSSCGFCGVPCVFRNGVARCVAGACVLAACSAPFQNCDGDDSNGCETTPATSDLHCGACGRACSPANGTGACANGRCRVVACRDGYENCDGDRVTATGCEADLRSDPMNCGGCGIRCPSGQSCVDRNCVLVCPSGQRACGGRCVDADAGC